MTHTANPPIQATLSTPSLLERLQTVAEPMPAQRLLIAIEQTLEELQEVLQEVLSATEAGTAEHIHLAALLTSWKEARRLNR